MRKKGAAAEADVKSSDKNPPKKLPIDEALKLLDDVDKAYIRGYIDRALFEQKRKPRKKQVKKR